MKLLTTRIQLDTKFNGEKAYSPQAFVLFPIAWQCIIEDGAKSNNIWYRTSHTESVWYQTEKEAQDIIDKYLEYIKAQNLKKVESTEYIKYP